MKDFIEIQQHLPPGKEAVAKIILLHNDSKEQVENEVAIG